MKSYEHEAKQFCEAIRAFNESQLENLELYLSFHFGEWLEKYANTPADLACEMREFSSIEF